MEVSDHLKKIEQTLAEGNSTRAASQMDALHPADVASIFEELEDARQDALVDALRSEKKAELVAYLSGSDAGDILRRLEATEQRAIFDHLPDDDLVDVLQDMDAEQRAAALEILPDSKKTAAHSLLRYPEDTAGGRMTTNLAMVEPAMTIRETIDTLQDRAESTEVLARIFVVHPDSGKLLGKVRLRDLTFNRRSTDIREIMQDETIAVHAMDDQEEAVRLMTKYDIFALPVVDDHFKLIGVITYDDALEIQEEESTEDLEKQSAISGAPSTESYLSTPIRIHLRRRFGWVLFLALVAIISGVVIFQYEDVLSRYFVLAIYMPMVVAAGGNTGGQAATMVIRAMSLGEFDTSAILKVAWKEARVGLFIGSMLGVAIAFLVFFIMPTIAQTFGVDLALPAGTGLGEIAVAVGLSLAAQITTSTLVGAILPIGAKAVRLDPAVVASPAITTIVDVTGLIIYFGLAKAMLGI